MSVKEMFLGGSGALVVILSLIQVSKIEINPWTAIFGWIGKQVNHEVLTKVTAIEEDIKTMKADIVSVREEDLKKEAKDCRYRILRFSDECYLGINHSHEHYKQILCDITLYEQYCISHPDFPNQIATAAIKQVKETYETHLNQHDFLDKVDSL